MIVHILIAYMTAHILIECISLIPPMIGLALYVARIGLRRAFLRIKLRVWRYR